MVKSLPSNAGRVDSIPGQAVGILHASWPKTNKKQANKQTKKKTQDRSNVMTHSTRDFKNGPHQKKKLNKIRGMCDFRTRESLQRTRKLLP